MELNAPNGEIFVPDSHDLPLVRMSGYGKTIGQGERFHDKRMIAGRDEGGGEILEQARPIVPDGRSLAMHQLGRPDDFPSECLPNALVSEADSEKRFFPRPFEHRGQTDACPVGITGTGREYEPPVFVYGDLPEVFRIISQDLELGSEFTEVLYQVIGKGIVVIYDEQTHLCFVNLCGFAYGTFP